MTILWVLLLLQNYPYIFRYLYLCTSRTSLVAQMAKRLPTMQETRVRSLGWEDPLEKEMVIHSSTLAWKIPRTEEPGPWGRKESDTTDQTFTFPISSHSMPFVLLCPSMYTSNLCAMPLTLFALFCFNVSMSQPLILLPFSLTREDCTFLCTFWLLSM